MGTWGSGPFDNDAAADFLGAVAGAPARSVTSALRTVVRAPAGTYIEADEGAAGWAACELVALAFGLTDGDGAPPDHIAELATRLRPKEEQRVLALDALPRIGDRAESELAQLWHEGGGPEGPAFDAALDRLRARLEAAAQGPRALEKPKPGDLFALNAAPSAELVIVQVVAAGEVAVFEGTCGDAMEAFEIAKSRPARRVPASVRDLARSGRKLGNLPVRKALKGRKLYAQEVGLLEHYALASASGAGLRLVTYDEAAQHDAHQEYDEEAIVALAGGAEQPRVRSPEERESALRATRAEAWAARRRVTTPGPFGDVAALERWLQWVEDCGIANAVQRHHDQAIGRQGYGRPSEDAERRDYIFAGLVAIWRNTWPRDTWPAELAHRLPAPPDTTLMALALPAARTLASRVLTRDAEIRLIWDDAPDGGAALRAQLASMEAALAE